MHIYIGVGYQNHFAAKPRRGYAFADIGVIGGNVYGIASFTQINAHFNHSLFTKQSVYFINSLNSAKQAYCSEVYKQ